MLTLRVKMELLKKRYTLSHTHMHSIRKFTSVISSQQRGNSEKRNLKFPFNCSYFHTISHNGTSSSMSYLTVKTLLVFTNTFTC